MIDVFYILRSHDHLKTAHLTLVHFFEGIGNRKLIHDAAFMLLGVKILAYPPDKHKVVFNVVLL